MNQRTLSRPQRAMLANAIAGRPLEHDLSRIHQACPLSTAQALHRKGKLAGINHCHAQRPRSPRQWATRKLGPHCLAWTGQQ